MSTTDRPQLTGITNEDGQCDRCHRELGKVYEVRHPDGTVATYGRRCCAKVTGWSNIDKALIVARRCAVIDARRASVAAAFGFDAAAVARTDTDWTVAEIIVNDRLWDGHDEQGHSRGWARWADWQAALTEVLGR